MLTAAGELQWHTIDVSKLVGHRAYLEVTDSGGGFAELDAVYFAPALAPEAPVSPLTLTILHQSKSARAEDVAFAYERVLRDCIERWRESERDGPALADEDIAIINWLLSTDLLPSEKAASTSSNSHSHDI